MPLAEEMFRITPFDLESKKIYHDDGWSRWSQSPEHTVFTPNPLKL